MDLEKKKTPTMIKVARLVGFAFAAFLSVFAMDVFAEPGTVLEILTALLMHLIPTFLVLAVVLISWKREWLAALLFILLDVFYISITWNRVPWVGFGVITALILMLALVYFFAWKARGKQNQ